MQTYRRLLEQSYSGGRVYQPKTIHHCFRRVKPFDRHVDTLPAHSHGLGLTYNQRPESHSDMHIPTRCTVSQVAPLPSTLWLWLITTQCVYYLYCSYYQNCYPGLQRSDMESGGRLSLDHYGK